MQKQLSSLPRAAKSATRHVLVPPPIPGVIEVVELPDRQQRHLDALRVHINELLADQWLIASRNPLTLRRGQQVCYVLHGMLVSEGLV
ncbi:hypothetical protein [Halopseudomonas pelagia]|uniref:hypothetical protein n=1 Tax=Halopseudomonas pelagia TaxID=553151 RepID=UPI00039DA4AB|nr:hypothetical protein [Halopseudomonas pelagia]